ncbi:MAG: hypothetical protein QE509_01550, partial [Gammaproteobacteria bacterium]|nr:hypothetical protein [Gammaproteobacteria bacterium]
MSDLTPPTASSALLPAPRKRRASPLFLVTVFLPTLVAVLYYGFFAADIYISEARFVVRSPQRQTATGFGEFMQRAGFSRSDDDTYSVRDYMLSRDALKRLDEQFSMSSLYGEGRGDFFTRFPWIDFDTSFEALHRYYQKRVQIDIDPSASISTLRVQAFTREDAFRINEMLLEMGEQLINKLNERGRQDLMKFAAEEVATAEAKAKAAARAVREFRNRRSVFDPEKQSSLELGQISKMQEELVSTRAQLAESTRLARDNPRVRALRDRVSTLEGEIEDAKNKVAGSSTSLSNKTADYERLALEQEFADKQLATALASLEQARNEAQRKQLYLERIVQASTPDVAVEPKRFENVVAT